MKNGPNNRSAFSFIKSCVVLTLVTLLAACGGSSNNYDDIDADSGGGSGSGDGGVSSPQPLSLGGGGVKGPLANAVVTVYGVDTTATGFKGGVVETGETNASAQIVGIDLPPTAEPPFIVEITSDDDTTDLTTGVAPVIRTMRTVVTREKLDSGAKIYATPLTTMAVGLAIRNADANNAPWNDREDDTIEAGLGDSTITTAEFLSAIPIAAVQVKSTVGFGMSGTINIFDAPPLIDDTTDTAEKQEDTASYRAAVEAVTAVVAQINDAVGSDDADSVLDQVTNDLADGQIDGRVDNEVSDLYAGDEESANASLELFQQDPATLPIPNSDKTVGEIKEVLDGEKASTGNNDTTTEINTTEQVAVKPAETDPDLDDDGVPNDQDAFPLDPNEQRDNDLDGIGDNADTDDDNDGVSDVNDDFPFDPDETRDTDGDGVGNNADTDDDGDDVPDVNDDFPLDGTRSDKTDQDNDGWPSDQDPNDNDPNDPPFAFVDTDGDGIGNSTDDDDDNDGVNDDQDDFPTNPAEQNDQDNDGIGDNSDPDIDGDGVANEEDQFPRNPFETLDTDGDGQGNNSDTDDDNDKVSDLDELALGTDPLDSDSDNDGVLDNVDQAPNDPNVQFDSDRDGVDNADDNCALKSNPNQTDTDEDGRGDVCDTDDDGDGIPDADDDFPLDASRSNASDQDGDGWPNGTDPDDNDANNPGTEYLDTDGDGIPDGDDLDADNDGVSNEDEAAQGTNPLTKDFDADGVDDGRDNCPVDANANQSDLDRDGFGDVCDDDTDNDGVLNADDRCEGIKDSGVDSDDDGIDDICDTDKDGDTVENTIDNCPAVANADQTNTDGDFRGDACDTDDDNDGILDGSDPFPTDFDGDDDGVRDGSDNCPAVANAEQNDLDADGTGDACDTDLDGDTVPNASDNCPATANSDQADSDDDGLGDACEVDTDNDGVEDGNDNCPAVPNNDQLDTDEDGLGNACDSDDDGDSIPDADEPAKGTNPLLADTDDDGSNDAVDNCPLEPNADQANTDGDNRGNACDTDDDNDGLSDSEEEALGTDPLSADTDKDSVDDSVDNCPVVENTDQLNTDGDAEGNACDSDDDNDNVADVDEPGQGTNPLLADTDSDGTNDDTDNCPVDANEDQLNTDGDEQGNVCDSDDDNDGVSDADEADQGTNPLLTDSDEDTIDDNVDNCPVDANQDQADLDSDNIGNLCDDDDDGDGVADTADNCPVDANSDQTDVDDNGVGDACDVAQIGGFYLDTSTVQSDGVTEQAPTNTAFTEDFNDMCNKTALEEFAQVAHIEQLGANLVFSFAQEFDGEEGGQGTINLANEIIASAEDYRTDEAPDGSVYTGTMTLSYTGTLNPDTGVISGVVTESFVMEDDQGVEVFSCTYVSDQTMTPMDAVASSVVLEATGSDQGYVFMEADERYVEGLDEVDADPTFEFEYGIVSTNGETFYLFDTISGMFVEETEAGSDYLLGSSGWALVPDAFSADASGDTAVITRELSGVPYERLEVDFHTAVINGEPMADFVPEAWRDAALVNPSLAFSGVSVDVKAVAIEAVSTLDVYQIGCDGDFMDVTLECPNKVSVEGTDGEPTTATALGDVLFASGTAPSSAYDMVQVGNTEQGQLRAYLTGSDTSGADGSSGDVTFYEVSYDTTGNEVLSPVTGTASWSISDPFSSGDLVLEFAIPETVSDVHFMEDDSAFVILAVVADTTAGDVLRIGGKRPAGESFKEQGLNVPGIDEVVANFSYLEPDFDGDGVIDLEDNCPADANSDQSDLNEFEDGFGQGDACEDADGDGIPIGLDEDNDNDGTPDTSDPCPFDPEDFCVVETDSDNDGTPDSSDPCPTDPLDQCVTEPDSDNDGTPDSSDPCPTDPLDQCVTEPDSDNDGTPDSSDPCPTDPLDQCVTEPDSDNDGTPDSSDPCPTDPQDQCTGGESPFTAEELAGATKYNVYFDDACNGGEWVVESFSWDGTNYTLGATCGGTQDETGPYEITQDGVLLLTNFGEYIRRIGTDGQSGAALLCWADTEADSANCDPSQVDYLFDDEQSAIAFADSRNSGDTGGGTDSDGDNVDDINDPFPFDGSESADTDEDGVGDNQDAFPNLASEQFDSDGDGVGNNADLCPLVASPVQGSNHTDTDGDGLGDECDTDPLDDASGVYLLTNTPDIGNQNASEDGLTCVPVEDGTDYQKAVFEQEGNQLIMYVDGNAFGGVIDEFGSFELNHMFDAGNTTTITGIFSGGAFTSVTYEDPDTLDDGVTVCEETGSIELDSGVAVTEQTVFQSGGITWFESDLEFNQETNMDEYEFAYGTITDGALETIFNWDAAGGSWVSEPMESNYYLTASGVVSADDRFIIDGYVDSTNGETAIIKPTVSSVAVDYEIVHVDLAEINVETLPIAGLLGEDFAVAIADTATFTTGARAYIGTITEAATSYTFWCDEDWDQDWFSSQSLSCNNIVPVGYVEDTASGGDDFDPVPATSFDEVVSTPSEIEAMSQSTRDKGIWVGDGDGFDIDAYLVTDDGTAAGANKTVVYMKRFYDTDGLFKVGEGVFVNGLVGSTATLEWEVPESVANLADMDEGERNRFLFVDTDTLDGATVATNILRRGEILTIDSVENELLFNSTAREDILAAFSYSAASPLVGAWVFEELDGNVNVLVFVDDTNYIIGHTANTESDPGFGVVPTSAEYGTYTWDQGSGAFTVTVNGESDGVGGLSDPDGALTLSLEGGQLAISDNGGTAFFASVGSEFDPLVGAWSVDNASGDLDVLVFINNTDYIIMHSNNTEPDPDLGTVATSAEHGTYTWNDATGDFTATVIDESDGFGGLSNPDGSFTLDLVDDQITIEDASGPAVLNRVAP